MSAPTDVRPAAEDARPGRGARVAVQRFGTALSNMVMPNIGAFIAWGLITALFIEAGWITLVGDRVLGHEGGYGFVEHFGGWGAGAEGGGIVGPTITYLLPILIGYTGGRMMYGDTARGGVVGAIATMGAIAGADVPMFLGAMVMGPLGGWSMKKLDALWADRIRPGFEMLVNNFAAGIWGMLLAVVGFVAAGPFVSAFSTAAERVVDVLVDNSVLPLTSVLVEPAKVLFLNNAINHGVFTPLGTAEAASEGQSILFLIEANPGPGLGLLLAFTVFGTGMAKASAPGAALIQFVGGIHEIYFPYVLMKPVLIVAMIAGGMTGVATNLLLDSGLRAPAGPGSIIAVLLQSPAGSLLGVTLSVVLSAAVTFVVAGALLRTGRSGSDDLAGATADMVEMKGRSSIASSLVAGAGGTGRIRTIVFACDAGMGSSAMGASVLRRKVHAAGFTDVTVDNRAIASLTDDVDLVVTHRDLTERARGRTPSAVHVSVDEFLASPRYDDVVALLQEQADGTVGGTADGAGTPVGTEHGAPIGADQGAAAVATAAPPRHGLLARESIVLDGAAQNRDDAIDEAGRLLVAAGAVPEEYVAAMHERELSVSTLVGNGLAIPHGTDAAKDLVRRTSLSFVRYTEGVDWGGQRAEFVVAIAGTGDDHLQVLSALSQVFLDEAEVDRLRAAGSPEEVLDILGAVQV
ncbi:PTS mannitol transporter subunit IICBA [Georgenia sp. Z1491]|uniref:PTS mannitol transporter subunit IICBA n=1 Tax=Georgenia sp. Z1491 TaxID=3416707 RepID=UPI003CEC0E39